MNNNFITIKLFSIIFLKKHAIIRYFASKRFISFLKKTAHSTKKNLHPKNVRKIISTFIFWTIKTHIKYGKNRNMEMPTVAANSCVVYIYIYIYTTLYIC